MGLPPNFLLTMFLWLWRQTTDFCILSLYPYTFLKVFTGSENFPGEAVWSFLHRIILSTNRDNFLSVPVGTSLVSFSCLVSIIYTLALYWTRGRKEGTLVLFLTFMEILCHLLYYIVLLYSALNTLSYIPMILEFFLKEVFFFMMTECWFFFFLVKALSASIDMIMWFLSLNVLMLFRFIDFHTFYHSYIPGIRQLDEGDDLRKCIAAFSLQIFS